jgi:hypothetical protein
MGISTNIYAYLGIKIAWDQALWDILDSREMSGRDNEIPEYLADNMGGEYIVLGKRLYDSGDARWGFEQGDFYREIDTSLFDQREAAYKTKFRVQFPQFAHYMDQPFKLMMFFHWS